MSVDAYKDPNLGQNNLILQINNDLAELGQLAGTQNTSLEAKSPLSEKVAGVLGALYSSVSNVEQAGKPFADRRVVMEQAAKVLDEVEQLSGISGDTKAQAATQTDKKEAGGILSDSVRQCRAFLKEKRENMENMEWDNFNREVDKIFPRVSQILHLTLLLLK